MADHDLKTLRATLLARFPELAGARLSVLANGWDSLALDVDSRLIFKFPRDAEAAAALRREAALLAIIRPAVSLPVPDLALVSEAPLFSRHAKLPGEHLLASDYQHLPEPARERLAADLARFHAELHAIEEGSPRAAGALPIKPWQPVSAIRARALPLLPENQRPLAERTLAAFAALPPDPHGQTYGFFDGHGWNMAFDHAAQKLNGVYDFADSGFGPLHQEFIYAGLISPDLVARLVAAYEAITGKALDRERIHLLAGVHRLSELAELADQPEHVPAMLGYVAEWAGWQAPAI